MVKPEGRVGFGEGKILQHPDIWCTFSCKNGHSLLIFIASKVYLLNNLRISEVKSITCRMYNYYK